MKRSACARFPAASGHRAESAAQLKYEEIRHGHRVLPFRWFGTEALVEIFPVLFENLFVQKAVA